MGTPLWTPGAERRAHSRLTQFEAALADTRGLHFADGAALHRWSVTDLGAFWRAFWAFADVLGEPGAVTLAAPHGMPGARFFPEGSLSVVENLLRGPADRTAILATSEAGRDRTLTLGDLRREVARFGGALRAAGVQAGDRVCGIVTNIPEAVVAALGTASIGAVWSSCSPDFGVDGIVDRFGQIEPVVLVAVDGYQYAGKWFDRVASTEAVAMRIPSIRTRVIVSMREGSVAVLDGGALAWEAWQALGDGAPLATTLFPFNHPLYVMYSSGTTGVPKCIVHGAGGTLLEHLKEHQLHADIRPGDRVFYFTTCGWMMWNWLVSALASGATLVLFDGAPVQGSPTHLFDIAAALGVTFFGVSPRYLDAVRKADAAPIRTHTLPALRTIASTGSPLPPELFDFVHDRIKRDVHLTSISGGTDIIGCFLGGDPNAPVWRGELQAPGLGMDVQIYDPEGRPLHGRPGELICAAPFPSMPVGFWNDPDGALYRRAYFERFPGVWCHGDWCESTAHGGFIVHGRSDATLNPGGVRIGTAEIYRQIEQVPGVLEGVAVAQSWQGDERVVLFVRLAAGLALDDALRARIVERLRTHASPRHVPARILQVPDVPRTRSGKTVEIAVRKVIHGQAIDNVEALANPESLEAFRERPELQV